MGLARNLSLMLGSLVARKVDGRLYDWIDAISLLLDGEGGPAAGLAMAAPFGLNQSTWFIDPINGSDTNDGKTSTSALKTDARRQVLWGGAAPTLVQQPTTITYTSSVPTSDPVNFDARLARGASLLIQGTRTTTKASTLQAVTALNRAFQTPWSVTDVVGALGAADVGRIMRITGGARAGNSCRVMKDNGAGNVRITPMGKIAYSFLPFTQVTPVAGDSYEIVTLPSIPIGIAKFGQLFNDQPSSPANCVQFDSLTLDGSANLTGLVLGDGITIFYAQSVLLHIGMGGASLHNIAGGGVDGSFALSGGNLITMFAAGLFHSLAGFQAFSGSQLVVDADCLFQNCELDVHSEITGGLVSFFDGASEGRALLVRPGGTYLSQPYGSTDLIWGTANAGHGALAKSGGRIYYTTKPTVNGGLGAGRELLAGGVDTLWAAVPIGAMPANGTIVQPLA